MLQAGFARFDITPPLGTYMAGYYHERQADGILDPLLASCVAFRDAEGSTALVECTVRNADTKENARLLARAVISSSLTKAAIFGHDANWGRILCALGYSGASFDPENMELFFEDGGTKMLIYQDGHGTDYSEEEASLLLSKPEVRIVADMKMGSEQATAWGCDLTYDYVRINGDYRS